MSTQVKKIEFNTERLLAGISHFSKTSSYVTALNHSLKTYNSNDVTPFEVDGLPIIFSSQVGKIVAAKQDTLQWVLKKGFEELIAGLTQSLIEVHRFVMLQSLALKSEQINQYEDQIDLAIERIDNVALAKNFPTLIDDIEKALNICLTYKEEIISCNQVRNCLVHRLGIVTEKKDINNVTKNSLVLRYRDLKVLAQTPKGIFPLTKELKESEAYVENFIIELDVMKEHIIPVGKEVDITADIYFSVVYTSVRFIHELICKLPIPADVKSRLITQFEIG